MLTQHSNVHVNDTAKPACSIITAEKMQLYGGQKCQQNSIKPSASGHSLLSGHFRIADNLMQTLAFS